MKLLSGKVVIPLIVILCSSSAVTSSSDDAGVNQHRQVQTHSMRYKIHDDQLRETMFKLNALVSYSEQPGMPLDHDSKEFLKQLLDTVDLIAGSAKWLEKEDKIDHLGEEQISRYRALAEKLYSEAIDIDFNAKNMNVEEMNESFLKLNQTCIACHQMFRSL